MEKIKRFSMIMFCSGLTLFFIFHTLCVVYGIICITSSDFDTAGFYLDFVISNHNQELVYSVEVNSSCNVSNLLFNYDYLGSSEGCECTSVDGKKTLINSNLCNDNVNNSNCISVDKVSDAKLNAWRGLSTICTKRVSSVPKSSFTYYDYLQQAVSENSTCIQGHKDCGALDGLKNRLCIPNQYDCPLNYLSIGKSNDTTNSINQSSSYTLENSYKVFTSTDNLKGQVIATTSLITSKVCIDPAEIYQPFADYDLEVSNLAFDSIKVQTCSSYYNNTLNSSSSYSTVDSLSLSEIFESNHILANITSLAQYPKLKLNSNISIAYRNYIGWSLNCLNKNLIPSNLNLILTDFKYLYSAYILFVCISIIQIISVFVITVSQKKISTLDLFNYSALHTFFSALQLGIILINKTSLLTDYLECIELELELVLSKVNTYLSDSSYYRHFLIAFSVITIIISAANSYHLAFQFNKQFQLQTKVFDDSDSRHNLKIEQ